MTASDRVLVLVLVLLPTLALALDLASSRPPLVDTSPARERRLDRGR